MASTYTRGLKSESLPPKHSPRRHVLRPPSPQAATKAHHSRLPQILTLTMVALKIAHERGELDDAQLQSKLQVRTPRLLAACAGMEFRAALVRTSQAMVQLPALLKRVIDQKETVLQMAKVYRYASNFLYLGRGFNFPVALEGYATSCLLFRQPCRCQPMAL